MASGIKKAPDEWMSQFRASQALGISRHAVLMHLASGRLTGREIADRLVVSRASVEELKRDLAKAS